MEFTKSLPKILRGSVQLQWKRCGSINCRCSRGHLHGPYAALMWREGGHQKKRYVRLKVLPEIVDEIQREKSRRANFGRSGQS